MEAIRNSTPSLTMGIPLLNRRKNSSMLSCEDGMRLLLSHWLPYGCQRHRTPYFNIPD
jgi:hypothetical protein